MNELLDELNDMQKQAVEHYEGPLLILAGAGSGKTKVLTHRVAYLIEEYGVNPYNILALTFTNKAAKEMRERVDNIVSYGANSIWVSTFHSTCVRILRRYIDAIGYDRNFTIYDADDQKALMKSIIKSMNLDPKKYKEKTFLNAISNAKDELKTPEMFAAEVENDFSKKIYGKVYKEYQKQLENNNALDFDDLIMLTVKLFKTNEEILDYYQQRFQFILVDEYQDTNTAQFALIFQLASRYQNLCVVGDDDQSIYKFRGANIRNILDFEKSFPSTKTIRLEQNYRSTQNILDAANEVIKNNKSRKQKKLWTSSDEGAPINYARYDNEYEEAAGICSDIHKLVLNDGLSYSDFAILYRTNAQSRIFEEKLVYEGSPYKIVGAINFYSRREIKDMLCYLKTINNTIDDISIKRIINVPRRGIGAKSIEKISEYAFENDMSFYDALTRIDMIPGCSRAVSGVNDFVNFIEDLKSKLRQQFYSLENLYNDILEKTEYIESLQAEDSVEAEARIDNLDALRTKICQYEDDCIEEEPTLNGLLENIALVSDLDNVDDDTEQVLLMTIHSAKGLEFPHVYICGMEENVFPGGMAIFGDDPTEMEEERRLCYVGITRAKTKLTLTSANQRMRNGEFNVNKPSRFIHEIPRHLIKQTYGAIPRKEPEQKTNSLFTSGTNKAGIYSMDKNNPFKNNPYIQKGFSNTSNGDPDYKTGDLVSHAKFGKGLVTSMEKTDADYLVTVEFDGFGKRKLKSSFANLQKL